MNTAEMSPVERDRMCGSKTGLSKADAERRAFWGNLRVYPCPLCRYWHLTSSPRRSR